MEHFFHYVDNSKAVGYHYYYLKKGSKKYLAAHRVNGQIHIISSSMPVANGIPITDEYGWGTAVNYYGQEITICADSGDNFYVAVVPDTIKQTKK